jgi:hypothetical protein
MVTWQSIRKALGLPTEAEKIARQAFRRLHSDQRVAWTVLAADESDRFVVGVFHGETRPPSFTFFAVSKAGGEAIPLDDDSAYRPTCWR